MQRKGSQPPIRTDYITCQDVNTGEILDEHNTGIGTLLKYHTMVENKVSITRKVEEKATFSSIKLEKFKIAQIYVDFKSAQLRGGPYELYISLWAQNQSGNCVPLTEEFSVRYPCSAVTKKCAVFKNVEVLPGLCYVCRVARILDDLDDAKKAASDLTAELNQAMASMNEGSATNKSFRKPEFIGWAPCCPSVIPDDTRVKFFTAQTDSAFCDIVDIIAGRHNDQSVAIPVTDSWLEISSYAVDGVLDGGAGGLGPIANQRYICNTVRNGEYSLPDSTRNDIYVTLENGKFTQGKNIEVTMFVRQDDTGTKLEKCMQVGSVKYELAYKTPIWPGSQSPTWRETVRLQIPPELITRCHLYFQVRQVHKSKDKSSAPFAFAFYHLVNDKLSMSGEDPITIDCYKPIGNVDPSPAQYLVQGSTAALQQRKGESITIKIRSYTRIPKDQHIVDVLGLDGSLEKAGKALDSLSYSDSAEQMQFLPSIIESIFKVLENAVKRNVYNNSINAGASSEGGEKVTDELSMRCFKSLVSLLGTVMSERNKMYVFHKVALEQYIEEGFKNPSIHNYLLPCIIEGIHVDKTQTVKTLPLMLRFVVRSRMYELEEAAAGKDTKEDAEFRECLKVFFDAYFEAAAENVGFRGNAVKTFDCILGIVEPFFSKEELCSILADFLDCQSRDDSKSTDIINKSRLQLFSRLFDGVLHSSLESVPLVMQSVAELIAQHPRGSVGIMSQIADCFFTNIENPKARELFPEIEFFYHYLLSFTLTEYEECAKRHAAEIKKASSAAGKPINKAKDNAVVTDHQLLVSTYLTVLSIMLHLGVVPTMAEKEWEDGASEVEGYDDDDDENGEKKKKEEGGSEESSESVSSEEKKSSVTGESDADSQADSKMNAENKRAGIRRFFREMLEVLRNVVCDRELYSESWYSMTSFRDQVVSQVLCLFKDYYFPRSGLVNLPGDVGTSELEVWALFITTCFEMLRSFRLVTNFDVFPNPELAKSSYVDTEKLLIPLLSEGWGRLTRKEQLIPVVVPYCFRLLNAATGRDPTSNDNYMNMLCEMLVSVATEEYDQTERLSNVTGVGCKVIDEVVRAKDVPKEVIFTFLGTKVKEAFDKIKEDDIAQSLNKLLSTFNELLKLSVEFRDMPTGPEYEEERMVATMKMLDYFKGFDIGSYFHYVHSLYAENIKGEKKSYIEAANSIMLHANALAWSEKSLPEMQGTLIPLPAEASWMRKVRLYEKAIELYRTAEFWEEAFRLTRILNKLYLKQGNFAELAKIVEIERDLLSQMSSGTRKPYQYFFISYIGNGFPESIANKNYIYRGDSNDTSESVRNAIIKRFKDALPLDQSANLLECEKSAKKYVLVSQVFPSSKEETENKGRSFPKHLPEAQREHLLTSGTNVFAQRIMSRDGRICVSKMYYFTAAPLPHITRSNEVVAKKDVPVPPVVGELEALNSAYDELNESYLGVEGGTSNSKLASFSSSTMGLTARIGGALARYKNEFFTPAFEDKENQERLYDGIKRIVELLEVVLAFHDKECPAEFRNMHESIESNVKQAKESFDFISSVFVKSK